MRRLLIADDERNIRLGLKAMIEREFPGSYEIFSVSDGKQALEQHEREPADIVLTDIRMPVMDGIELIKRLADRPEAPALLILSGYDDFLYAKEAIKHKVKEYLLKPIVREDLFAALGRIEKELEFQESVAGRLEATDRLREAMRVSTASYILASKELGEEEVAARCAAAGLQDYEPSYYVGIIDPLNHQRNMITGMEFLSGRAQDDTFLPLEDNAGRLVVLTSRPELLEELTGHLASFGGTGAFAAAMSEEGTAIGQLKAKYDEACQALKYRLLLSRSEPVLIHYAKVKDRRRDYRVNEAEVRKLSNMLGTDRDKEMKAILMELFDPNALAEADIGYFEEVSRALNEWVFDHVFRTYGEASADIINKYKTAGSLYNFGSIQDFIHNAEDLLFGLNDYIRALKSAHFDQKEMARAVAYIQSHYDKDLSMTVVSNHVSLNYSYFSERFKEYTGESFVNYLKKVRIHKAKELLESTDGKIHEISRKVGFESPKQFNRVFRELEGITAMEYRRKIGYSAEKTD